VYSLEYTGIYKVFFAPQHRLNGNVDFDRCYSKGITKAAVVSEIIAAMSSEVAVSQL
jgi:hypothetical protein